MTNHHSPLDQFKIHSLIELKPFGYDISFTNSALVISLVVLVVSALLIASSTKPALIPSRLQFIGESLYQFVDGMMKSIISTPAKQFFPFIFTLFIFILFCNIFGLFPYSFTPTSHIIVTFALGLLAMSVITIYGLIHNGLSFFSIFLPSGVPKLLAPLIITIEVFAYLIRPLTLAVRLCANMVAGHIMLKVIAGFVIMLGLVFGIIPFAFITILTAFEFFIAALQSYIFAVLVCVYLNDVLREH